jgi:DNA polymerase-4
LIERTFGYAVGVEESADTSGRRVIAHIDADAFYATVHLIEDPSLAGKPVIVAHESLRSIVTTASYEARKYGVHSAMPSTQARRLCPHATFLRPNFDLYRDYSRRAMAIVGEYVQTIEPLSLDEAYLDVTELDRPIATLREMVARIHAETGLRYSVGIGPNKLCAKVLSDYRKPAAFNVASREQCCELFAGESPRLINGIGPKTVAALEAIGITTIELLRDAPVGRLVARFGERRAREMQALARFEHHGRVHRDRGVKSVSEERTFEHDVDELEDLAVRLRDMAIDLCGRLERRQLQGRTIGIKVRLADFTTVTRARTLDERTNDPLVVSRVADELLREYDPPQPVRLLGVRLAAFDEPAARDAEEEPQLRLPIPSA